MIIKEHLFNEMNDHLLMDERPSDYFENLLRNNLIFRFYPFNFISSLNTIPQSPAYHPEGNVWNHTMMVIDIAARKKDQSANQEVLMWSALLHDIGKNGCTRFKNGKITVSDHDIRGGVLAQKFLWEFKKDSYIVERIASMVRWHMQFNYAMKDLPYDCLDRMVEACDIFEIGLLSLCDRLGRGGLSEKKIKEEEKNILLFMDAVYRV